MSSQPIAAMVVSPSYRSLAREAMRRVKKFTGLEVQELRCGDKEGFEMKLHLDRVCRNKQVLIIDADLWILRPWNLSQLMGSPSLVCCHDSAVWNPHSFCWKDCHDNGLDKFSYFNSGMMIWDFQRKEHCEVFKMARASWRSSKIKREDKSDQFHLNRAVMNLRIPITFLHERHNCYTLASVWGQTSSIPREIIGLHAAGVPLKMKHDVLRAESSVFGRVHQEMCPEAIRWNYAKQHELP